MNSIVVHPSIENKEVIIHQPLIVTAQLNLRVGSTNLLVGPPKLGGPVPNSIFYCTGVNGVLTVPWSHKLIN